MKSVSTSENFTLKSGPSFITTTIKMSKPCFQSKVGGGGEIWLLTGCMYMQLKKCNFILLFEDN